jgi:hypothetical protein
MVLVPREEGFWADIQEFFDSLQLKWYRWVVEYDLEKQLEVFKGVGNMFKVMPAPDGKSSDPGAWKRGVKKWVQDPTTWLIFASPLILMILWRLRLGSRLVIWLLRRLRRQPSHVAGRVGDLYSDTLRALAKRGLERRRSETPRAYAARLKAHGFERAADLELITRAFERALYRGEEANDNDFVKLKRASGHVRRT